MNQLVIAKEPGALAGLAATPPAVFLRDEYAAERFFGFFTANHQNKHTRRAYYKAACRFSDLCARRGLTSLADVKPPHLAAYIEWLGKAEPEGQGLSKPTVKQHLAALRMLFDWLVIGHVLDTIRRTQCAARNILREKERRRCSTGRRPVRCSRLSTPTH